MDVDVQNYQISCESQFIIQLQISRYAWGVPLITLSDNGDFTVIRSRGWSRLANGMQLEVYYFANNSLLTWDKNRKNISYSKAGRLYACALYFSYSPKVWR
ncbi:TPA: hypothetical protein I8374_002276 [Serratia marcescens]|jgi:hypothetical protein|uniref:hypothetical protein n=1 Tax=Serratia TaxID=613 RepID=UPI000665DB68|nr:hypothetical protein [Serratia marcescens]MBH2670375.1 hypothetical protein [Serratia marcescens]MBH2670845.1 hypothetical protein [Serratia marcescens]MBH3299051.1 hypothetical protein [Serratia marcescens]MDP8800011.1 hypothetical protein [Serratia marcescens]MDX7539384.1 hypothetical protein [Serratia marcescens]